MPRPTLHISILTLFVFIILISMGTLTWLNYKENSKAALEIAEQLLTEVNGKVLERVNYMFGETFRLAHEAPELSFLANKPEFMRHDAQWFLAESLLQQPHIYSAYIGYADGDFYQIISLRHANESVRSALGADDKAELAVRSIFRRPGDGRRIELWQFLDGERRLVGSRVEKIAQFNPCGRPWFKMAIGVEGVTQTPFYIFSSTGSMGLTVARRFDGPVPGVFGVDITLDELSSFFAQQKVGRNGLVFMFDSMGFLTAHPDPEMTFYPREVVMGQPPSQASLASTGDPLLFSLWESLESNLVSGDSKRVLDVNGESYLMHITPVSDERLGDQYIAVAAPVGDFTKSVDRVREQSLYFSLAIVMMTIPIAMYMSRTLSGPLKKLANEADEIRKFNLELPVDVKSRIAEIHDLNKAVKTMKSSLSTFGRYVPRTLVRQLLLSKLAPDLGGERREATLLFSDIADFTTISESMQPEELMLKVSEYLQEIGSVILEKEGTIDKFIGDAVMAFWNAPDRQENHVELACEAALLASRASEALNEKWQALGMPAMHTRFGLHTGDAIIGNVGSEDRMNYTALGASVNLASRLEGLNKYYGTRILVSEPVVKQAGDRFLFRPVGKVIPKGTTIPVPVYELVGGDSMECHPELGPGKDLSCDVKVWEKGYAAYQAQDFGAAALVFEKCAEEKPQDRLAIIMLERAQYLAEHPPGPDWDGVDVFKTK